MTTETQESGAATNEPGGQQNAEGKAPEAGNAGAAGEQTTQPNSEGGKPGDTAAEIVYEFKAPEGMNLDQDQVTEFTTLAKDLKLPADKAQAVVDLAIKAEIKRAEAFESTKQQWADEIKADKALGGDKLDQTLATAKKAFDLLPAEEAANFKQMLETTGYGNHPSLIRLLHAVGSKLSEDTFVPGSRAAAASTESNAQRMYPNMNP